MGLGITVTVVAVVADGLHGELRALLDHHVSVAATLQLVECRNAEQILACRDTVLGTELGREDGDVLLTANEPRVVLTRVAPCVRVDWDVAEGVVAVGTRSVRAEAGPLDGDLVESSRHEGLVRTMGAVGHVMRLSEVQSMGVSPAVGTVVADGLHAKGLARTDHEGGVRAAARPESTDGEDVLLGRDAVLASKRSTELSRLGAHEARIVLARVTPRVRVDRDVAESIVAVGTVGVRAERVPVVFDVREAARHVVVVVAVWPVRNVVGLTDVDRSGIVPAVVTVVADGLHAVLLAHLDHTVGVRAATADKLADLELICARGDTVLARELGLEGRTLSADEARVGLARVTPCVRVLLDVAEGVVAVGGGGVRAEAIPVVLDAGEA